MIFADMKAPDMPLVENTFCKVQFLSPATRQNFPTISFLFPREGIKNFPRENKNATSIQFFVLVEL